MTEEQSHLLSEFRFRMRELMRLCERLKEQNSQLKEELKGTQEQVEELQTKLQEVQTKYKNLQVARQIGKEEPGIPQNEDTTLAKERLKNMVREIDRCITLLKQ